ncbi:MAG: sarcosine oxidase subunit alpha family protein [Alphaproteobacteria bacterium]|nr:sarcosine oxidase subunit alpha family protein [Alphaproteobacteria bacterium]
MTDAVHRLENGGRIDRTQRLKFRFDGEIMHGHPGDTLASALLANGVRLVGRSFKYHRPRGLMAAGGEEPNGLVRLRQGGRAEPNVRATEIILYDGLVAESQNRWPSLKFDLGAVNDRLSPLFPAGFYYKTFMWPASLWPTYEAVIRRMAGLGKAAESADPDRYEKQYAHCDVLVVGAGPAGLAAAHWAGRTGARVILADEGAELGGALLGNGQRIDGQPGMNWAAGIGAELAKAENVRLLPRTIVAGYYDHNALTLLERVADHLVQPDLGQPRQRLWQVRAKQVVLATGALERPLVLANNDRPGVMGAGAVQTYINRYGVRPGRRAVLFTNNDSAYPAAMDLARAGVEVAAVVELRAQAPLRYLPDLEQLGIELLVDRAVLSVTGRKSVTGVQIGKLNEAGDGVVAGLERRIDCDLLCLSGGWTPSLHLLSQSGARLQWDAAQGCFLPGPGRAAASQAVRVAGAANGDFGLQDCLTLGAEAGNAAANDAGYRRRGRGPRKPAADDAAAPLPPRPIWSIPGPGRNGGNNSGSNVGKAFVDFQSDVTAADLRLAAREGYRSIEHVKRYTTTGMGTDQGRTSNINALGIVAQALDVSVPQVGHTTFRPPFSPVTFGALAGGQTGPLLDPVRRTPMHGWHLAAGAVFEPVGQWQRPYYYPRAGEDMAAAVDRESLAARTSVGLMDATTLGKIDIQGPDAAEFLNRIYTNGWKGLAVGGCRYGLMLGEDGMIFDDGVTARLGEDHFHMTTTTGNACHVLDWLESWLQTEWPELAVYCTSVTEQWAVAALCGPNARRLLAELCPDLDLSPAAFPYMTWKTAAMPGVAGGVAGGVEARIFRIGFTGELSFEINVPAGHGPALWQALMAAGERYAITPFGTEAMHVLRAEVGFIIVGQETDGTTTPDDLGLGRMVSGKKDFLGKRSLSRRDSMRQDRPALVGLLTDDPGLRVPEGAQLIAGTDPAPPQRGQGHVTSSYHSPNLGRTFALAMLEGGHGRHGETIHIAYDGRAVPATVTAPRFLDPVLEEPERTK